MKLQKIATTIALAILATSLAGTAHADGLTASLSKNSNISRDGESITLNIAGVPDGQGVYILQCVTPTIQGDRPTVCVGQSKTVWASVQASPGATLLTPTMTLNVAREFISGTNTIDCSVTSCGIFIRRDHRGPTDRSLDIFLPVSFLPTYDVLVSKTSGIVYSGEDLKVNVVGLTSEQGVYVRLCQSAATGERPSLCDGLGVWASMSSAQQAIGATNAASELTLRVKSSFSSGTTAVDCSKSSCVVFVRRDHLGGGDFSLDKVIPVTFSNPPVLVTSTTVTKVGTNFIFVIKNAKGKSIKVTVGSVVKTIKPTSDNYSYTVAIGANKGKMTTLKAIDGTKVLVRKMLKG